jgi:hypothetical protein
MHARGSVLHEVHAAGALGARVLFRQFRIAARRQARSVNSSARDYTALLAGLWLDPAIIAINDCGSLQELLQEFSAPCRSCAVPGRPPAPPGHLERNSGGRWGRNCQWPSQCDATPEPRGHSLDVMAWTSWPGSHGLDAMPWARCHRRDQFELPPAELQSAAAGPARPASLDRYRAERCRHGIVPDLHLGFARPGCRREIGCRRTRSRSSAKRLRKHW